LEEERMERRKTRESPPSPHALPPPRFSLELSLKLSLSLELFLSPSLSLLTFFPKRGMT
jgi:hypothetical protein